MKLVKGIYDQIINEALEIQMKERLDQLDFGKEKLDHAEVHEKLALYLSRIIAKGLHYYKADKRMEQQVEIANTLIENLARLVEDPEFMDYKINNSELLKSVSEKSEMKRNNPVYPLTSISKTSLFTGAHNEPNVASELRKEIASADRVDMIVSFIKFSGLRLIYDALKEHTKSKNLRVITTSYMGASDAKAIELLSQLPNTEVKISYDTDRTRLHAKAYYFHRNSGYSTAYIGSSNLSKAALTEGTEWNLKVSEYTSEEIIEKYKRTFESYWNVPEFKVFDVNSSLDIEKLRKSLKLEGRGKDKTTGMAVFDIRPYGYQQDILDHLEVERSIHKSYRNLLVAATGTGKTVISAFDYKEYLKSNPGSRMLFIAHRKEILEQSISTFRGILKDQNFGDLWVGEHIPGDDDHLFISIQTLNAGEKYKDISKDKYDYIVLDESHHGAAVSYENILNYFEPHILLGMTATPERMDGKSILPFFNNRIAYEIRLGEAIDRGLLCPFHYFGVSDSTDLSTVKWQGGRYDTRDLEVTYLHDDKRVQLILDALHRYVTDQGDVRAIGFCVSQGHARFMSDRFNKMGLKSMSLDSRSSHDDRRLAKLALERGEIQFIFVVDLYNEGVDIPLINTVLFLRPTESATVFIQQLGRGLRITDDKDVLTVLDFVGQANKGYSFRTKFSGIVGKTNHSLERLIENDFPVLPKGSFIHLEKKAKKHILENLKQNKSNKRNMLRYLKDLYYHSPEAVNLMTFLTQFNLSTHELYKTTTFTQLCYEAGIIQGQVNYPKHLSKKAFYRLGLMNSLKLIEFTKSALENKRFKISSRQEDAQMALMVYYTLFDKVSGKSINEDFEVFCKAEPLWINEMLEILDYNKARIDFIGKKIDLGYACPLELHARYTKDQILSAFDKHKEYKKHSSREGVLPVPEKETDVFFVTLNKSDKDFSASTMYEDYAISETLFHWQSQSRTSDTSATGLRYINQRKKRNKILIFVRAEKNKDRETAPFYFLGPANYVSHQGSKPISIVWELEHPIPAFLMRDVGGVEVG